MAKRSVVEASPMVWTVAQLGAFYTEHRSELLVHANRVLKDSAKAEEITQDALIKFMLAAPELESTEHALSYLHRTIENLCIDLFRLEGRRPNLVLLDDVAAEVEAIWQNDGDHSVAMSAAEDAAIIRQALALLSPAERAALVMWEVEGRSTEEIAAELGIKTSAVRHTVSRARASLRRILSELVLDEERGLTALDLLSTTYRKTSEIAKKSSKAALSLILVITAFLGFNSMTGNEGSLVPAAPLQIASGPTAGASSASAAPLTPTESAPAVSAPVREKGVSSQTPAVVVPTGNKKVDGLVNGFAVKAARLSFPGLDKYGIPTGFTITDSAGQIGSLFVGKDAPLLTDAGIVLSNQAMTLSGGPNILLAQSITVDGTGTSYSVAPAAGIGGTWTSLNVGSSTTYTERLANGQYLMTVTINIDSAVKSDFILATNRNGYDLSAAPKTVTTRLLLTAGKTQILAQAIQVTESGKGGTA
ncbi:MAG: RNA polymerase sigma factor [Candidatus Nanopelagicaceae bacterium]|nr:RNA polymerase sigma factor [Candidatus Nanopelagicaceae bacterium]